MDTNINSDELNDISFDEDTPQEALTRAAAMPGWELQVDEQRRNQSLAYASNLGITDVTSYIAAAVTIENYLKKGDVSNTVDTP